MMVAARRLRRGLFNEMWLFHVRTTEKITKEWSSHSMDDLYDTEYEATYGIIEGTDRRFKVPKKWDLMVGDHVHLGDLMTVVPERDLRIGPIREVDDDDDNKETP